MNQNEEPFQPPKKESTDHHYIPIFFLKHFTGDDGRFYIYDKTKDIIHYKSKSPKSHFYEPDRNTVDFSGHEYDAMERIYTDFDTDIAPVMETVLKNHEITDDEITKILMLVNLMKWRTPKSDDAFNLLKNEVGQEELGVKIIVKKTELASENDEEAIKHIEASDIYKESKRVLFAMKSMRQIEKTAEILFNHFIITSLEYPSLIGDHPVIEQQPSRYDTLGNFIFPLSSTDTLIYKKGSNKQIANSFFFIQRDLAIIDLAERYVACRNKQHLEKIVEIYRKMKQDGKTANIQNQIFNFIL